LISTAVTERTVDLQIAVMTPFAPLFALFLCALSSICLLSDASSECIDHTTIQLPSSHYQGAAASVSTSAASGVALFTGNSAQCDLAVDVFISTGDSSTWSRHIMPPSTGLVSGCRNQKGVYANNHMFFAGGTDGTDFSNTLDIYDLVARSWNHEQLSVARSHVGAAAAGNYVFFAGGLTTTQPGRVNTVDVYNTALHEFLPPNTIALASAAVALHGVTCANYAVFAAGDTATDQLTAFTVSATGTVSRIMLPLSLYRGQVSIVVSNGLMVIAGGATPDANPSAVVDIYSCRGNGVPTVFTAAQTLPLGGFYSNTNTGASILNRYAIFAGGVQLVQGTTNAASSTTVQAYDTLTNTWLQSIPPLQQVRGDALTVAVGNQLLVVGGYASSPPGPSNLVDVYTFKC
jgi:hypothetical protein